MRVYQRLLTAHPDDFTAAYQMARLLTWARRYEAADPFYRKVLALQPANPELWAAWGEALSMSGDARGRGALERALQLRPRYMRALLGLANLFQRNADYDNAVAYYKKALTIEPRNVAALTGLGDVLTYSQHEPEATAYYRTALQIARGSVPARLGLGRALVFMKRYAEGMPHLQGALKLAPDNEEAVQLLAFARSNAGERGEAAAIAAYRALLKRQREANRQARSWAAIGQLKTRQGDLAGAREAYATARRLAPTDNEITLAHAQSLMHHAQWNEASSLVAYVLRREPENIHARLLEFITESRLGHAERADELANQLVALEPSSPEDTVQMARALRQAGRDEAARQVLDRLAARNAADAVLVDNSPMPPWRWAMPTRPLRSISARSP